MDFPRATLYLDIAAKGLGLLGVALMIFGRDGWFFAGVVAVFLGVVLGGWNMLASRRMRRRGWDGTRRG